MALIFDIETDGLYNEVTRIHSLVIYDTEKQSLLSCCNREEYHSIETGLKVLQEAEEIAGHNIVKYDIPVIQKLYPEWKYKGKVFDTMLMSKIAYPDIKNIDMKLVRLNKLPSKLVGKYSLKAFGYRMGELKGEYGEQEGCWQEWNQDMQDYCEQDVKVTTKLYERLQTFNIPEETIKLEHQFASIIGMQERRGVYFDKEEAVNLAGKLVQEKLNLEEELKKYFPPVTKEETFIPKVNNKTRGYIKGEPFIKKYVIEFNPSSRPMIAERLQKKYNWKPKKLSPTGQPVIDETILEELDYPEAKLLKQYFLVTKVLGQLAEGNHAWLKLVGKDSVIHGYVDTIGTVTGRCTHAFPNLAQVPSPRSYMGKECRSLFKAREGYRLVGCDASGLELRCLAHYMGDKNYTHEILNGDIHSKNQQAAGLPTRDNAKTFIYGFLYGAGDSKVGSIIGKDAKEGKKIKQKFLKAIPKLKTLLTNIRRRVTERGYLLAIDGRKLTIREDYRALNVLLQAAGAIVMKKALCILVDDIKTKGWRINEDIAFILNIHDEYQAEVKPELVEEYKEMAVKAIRKAGDYFNFRCQLDGEAKEGENWYDTH